MYVGVYITQRFNRNAFNSTETSVCLLLYTYQHNSLMILVASYSFHLDSASEMPESVQDQQA